MNDITIDVNVDEAKVLNIGELYDALTEVKDERMARGKRYTLNLLLIVFILAKLCGEDKPYGIAEWAKMRADELQKMFNYHRPVSPSHKTIERLLAKSVIDEDLQTKLRHYLHQNQGGQQSILISLDGKTLRGTIPKGKTRGVHLLAAYLPAEGIVLLQVEVGQKENEIVVAPRILEQLDLKGRVVIGDAMFTQRDISVQILSGGGDYIWFVKDNQPTLHDDVERFFEPVEHAPGWHIDPLPQTVVSEINCQSGRVEKRTLTLIPDEMHYLQWPGAQTVFKLERQVSYPTKGEIQTETVYGITSLNYSQDHAQQLLQSTRQHWRIENCLHYRRDVTLREDGTRMKNKHQAQVMATLNNFVIMLTASLGLTNLASARRRFQARVDALLFSQAF